jgi:hypothetical protein
MTRTGERATVTGEAVPDMAPTPSATQVPDFRYGGTVQTPRSVSAPRSGDVHPHPGRAFLAGEGVPAPARPQSSATCPGRSSYPS